MRGMGSEAVIFPYIGLAEERTGIYNIRIYG
jgi:hypothetical protein